ncbi:hypothetical protein ACFYTC_32570 [Actinomadura nitritigenes]|uniref:hypothetical protein n=1 Tax=Actinomadura nitritigenes TaxID=134602 RepID=UPI0036AB46B8
MQAGYSTKIVQRRPGTRGFTPLPRSWVVERTLGRLMLHRRLARDYESLPAGSPAVIHITMTDLMTRRLTGENTPPGAEPEPGTKQKPQDETPSKSPPGGTF